MAILPNTIAPGIGTTAGTSERFGDVYRRLARLEATRSIVGAGTITGGMVSTTPGSQIDTSNITAGSITASLITAGAINAGHIAANSIDTIHLVAEAVTAAKIKANTITSNEIAANTITAGQIAADTITAAQIAANAITASELAANAVTAIKINVSNLAAISTDMGTISAGTITGATIQSGTSGSRWVGNATGLSGYASDGVTKTFEINTGSGVATLNGVVIAQGGSQLPASYFKGTFAGGNLLSNTQAANATTPMDGWNLYNNGLSPAPTLTSVTSTTAKYGTKVFRLTNGTDTTGQGGFVAASTNWPKVEEGKTYSWSYYAQPTTGTASCMAHIHWRDSSNAIIGSGNASAVTTCPSGSWTRVTVTATAPTGAVVSNPYGWAVSPASGQIVDFTGLQFEESDAPSAYAPRVDEILPNTVGTTQIAPGAVTSTELGSLSVTLGKIAANAVTTAEIAANAVTSTQIANLAVDTSKLDPAIQFGGGNLLSNGSAENYPGAWIGFNGTLATETTNFKYGSKALKITATSNAPQIYFITSGVGLGQTARVEAGKTYTFSAWVKCGTTVRSCQVVSRFADAAGAILPGPSPNVWNFVTGAATPGSMTAWTRVTATGVAPPNAVTSGIVVTWSGGVTGEVFYADGFQIEEGEFASAFSPRSDEILPGSIGKLEIATNAVDMDALTTELATSITQSYMADMSDLTNWSTLQGSAATVQAVSDAETGGKVARATTMSWMEWQDNIPFDPNVLYRVSARVRRTSAGTAGTVYVALNGIAADGVTRVNTAGSNSYTSQHYVCVAGQAPTVGTAWTTYTGYVKGRAATGSSTPSTDADAPRQLHTDAKFFRPAFLMNQSVGTDTYELDDIAIEIIEIPDNTVSASKLQALAVTAGKIATNAVTAGTIAANAVTAGTIAANAVTATQIAADTITAAEIAANAITATELQANAVTAGKIAANAVTAGTIAALAVTSGTVAANVITSVELNANAVTAGKIATGAVTAGTIAAGAVTATTIASGSVTTEKLTVGSTGTSRIVNGGVEDPSAADATLPANTRRNLTYTGTATTATRSAAAARSGGWGMKLDRDNTGPATSGSFWFDSVPVNEGEVWYVSFWARGVSGTQVAYSRVVGGSTFNSVGTTLTPDIISAVNVSTTWTRYTGQVTIPAGVTWAAPFVLNYGAATTSATAGTMYVDDVEFSKVTVSAQIADGAIIAAKIGANEVVAGKIAANAVSATELQANSVIAGKIATNAVTAGTVAANAVTAGTIAANAVTTTTIAAGAVTANAISAGAIQSQHLTVANFQPADVKNGAFNDTSVLANGLSFWNEQPTGPGVWTTVTDSVFGHAAQVTGATANSYRGQTITLNKGRTVIRGWVKGTGVVGGGGALINTNLVTGTATVTDPTGLLGTTDWTMQEGIVDVTSSTATVTIFLHMNATSAGTALFANIHTLSSVTTTEVSPGAIVTGHITTNTLDGGVIQAGTLNATKITASSITSTQIAASTITADKIAFRTGSNNLLKNSSFELGIGNVTAGSNNTAVVGAVPRSGNNGLILTSTVAGTMLAENLAVADMIIPPSGTPSITITAWIKAPSVARTVTIVPYFFTSANAALGLGTLAHNPPTTILGAVSTTSSWQRTQTTFPWTPGSNGVPATAAKFGWRVSSFGTTAIGEVVHVDDIQVEFSDTPSDWSVFIEPTMIDGTTITAPTIRTSVANPRLQLDGTDGLFLTDSSGNIVSQFKAGQGGLDMATTDYSTPVDQRKLRFMNSSAVRGEMFTGVTGVSGAITQMNHRVYGTSADKRGQIILRATHDAAGTLAYSQLSVEHTGTDNKIKFEMGDAAGTSAYTGTLITDSWSSSFLTVDGNTGGHASGTRSHTGSGAWINTTGGSTTVLRGSGFLPAANGSFTIPFSGDYRLTLWIQYQNASLNNNARGRINLNGGSAFIDLVTVWNGANAMNASGAGFLERSFSAGDTIVPELLHSEGATRNVAWRFSVDRVS